MKKLRSNLLSIALLIGISTGAAAKAGPWDGCNVNSRMELDLICAPANPICCKFLEYTWMWDSHEVFYQGQFVKGTYIPFD